VAEETMNWSWDLCDPSMTYMHRLGLGALARACSGMQSKKLISSDNWSMTNYTLTLKGDPNILLKIMDYTYQLRDGMLYIPPSYDLSHPPAEDVLAFIHESLLASALSKNGKELVSLAKDSKNKNILKTITYDYDGKPVVVRYTALAKLIRHSGEAVKKKFFNKKTGQLIDQIELTTAEMPGAKVTHYAANALWNIHSPANMVFLLYMTAAGVIPIKWTTKRGSDMVYQCGVIYPIVEDLERYQEYRPALNPVDYTECIAEEAYDVTALAYLRLQRAAVAGLDKCIIVTMDVAPWSKPQVSRTEVLHINFKDLSLQQYEQLRRVEKSFSSRLITSQEDNHFIVCPSVRPLFMKNILIGKPWHEGFHQRFPTLKDVQNSIFSPDKKGLFDMIQADTSPEMRIADAIHNAMRLKYLQLAEIYLNRPLRKGEKLPPSISTPTNKKFLQEVEKWQHELARIRRMEDLQIFLAVSILGRNLWNNQIRECLEEIFRLTRSGQDVNRLKTIVSLSISSYYGKRKKMTDDATTPKDEE
jgi:hypothetical protein